MSQNNSNNNPNADVPVRGPQDPPRGPPDNPQDPPGPPAPPEPLKKEELVQAAIARLSDRRPLTPAEARPMALLFKDLYKDTIENPQDGLSFGLWRKLQRSITSNWGRDDQILLKFCQNIINIPPARTLEEVERHQRAVRSLKDDDIPSSTRIQNDIAEEKRKVQEARQAEQKERERKARGEPKDPKDIPVSLESLAEQEQQIPGPPSPRTGRR